MEYMEVVNENDTAIKKAARELFKLTILAEEERITRVENSAHADFSFRREYFQKAINKLI